MARTYGTTYRHKCGHMTVFLDSWANKFNFDNNFSLGLLISRRLQLKAYINSNLFEKVSFNGRKKIFIIYCTLAIPYRELKEQKF